MTIDPTPPLLGLDTFGDLTEDRAGRALSAAQVIRNVVAQGEAAEQFGVDAFSVGEHHRPDFAVAAPEMVLAALAARTERITLGTAVTVLSTDDPVRLYERFSTLHALSNGRAEITVGRGSFTESFPLFGFDLADYERLFDERLELFAALRSGAPVTWSGETRAPLYNASVYPPIDGAPLRTWVGVGGSPESVVRAARHGLPLQLAIIGGEPARFAPFADLYRRALDEFGHAAQPIAVHSPGHVADSDDEALAELYPHFKTNRDRIGAERGWPPMSDAEYRSAAGPNGSLYVGSPETVARKIAATMRTLGASRFDLKYSNGPLPHEVSLRAIELYGTKVIPRVRELLAAD
ncbi:MAG: LLM class flavin-dependent oxidoreductase [Actinobacteria bacterium]|nr:LLM class flavin-dependent oxidoreductase [Actinomycetota bacterium]